MGTNYYLYPKPPCSECGREYQKLHIGKSSGGWCFSLHIMPDDSICDLPDWEELWSEPDSYIKDEYGTLIKMKEMYEIITKRGPGRHERGMGADDPWSPKDYEQNSAEPGPNGLVRHKLLKHHCIKHGSGTWDCIVGEFS